MKQSNAFSRKYSPSIMHWADIFFIYYAAKHFSLKIQRYIPMFGDFLPIMTKRPPWIHQGKMILIWDYQNPDVKTLFNFSIILKLQRHKSLRAITHATSIILPETFQDKWYMLYSKQFISKTYVNKKIDECHSLYNSRVNKTFTNYLVSNTLGI